MLEFIEQAIKLLVDKPDEVKVDIVETEQRIIYELTVGEGDYGIKEMGCVCVGCYAVYRGVYKVCISRIQCIDV